MCSDESFCGCGVLPAVDREYDRADGHLGRSRSGAAAPLWKPRWDQKWRHPGRGTPARTRDQQEETALLAKKRHMCGETSSAWPHRRDEALHSTSWLDLALVAEVSTSSCTARKGTTGPRVSNGDYRRGVAEQR